MIFVCCFRAEYVLEFKRKEDEKEDLDKKVIKNYEIKLMNEMHP